MSGHTPGPWKLHRWTENIGVCADRAKPRDCATVAMVSRGIGDEDRAVSDANATLIAAAPTLLDACRGALTYLRARGSFDTAEQQAPLIAAIEAATGVKP